jgi:hypothetical protein
MKLPLKMEERVDTDDMETYGSIDLIDDNNFFVALVVAEDEVNRTPENILETREDSVYILNAVNNFDKLVELIYNYKNHLLKFDLNNVDIGIINNILNSFKTIDYDNGIPYTWNEEKIKI